MFQSNLIKNFLKKTHCQIYFKITFDNFAITINDKIAIIAKNFKNINHVIINIVETANATTIILITRNKTNFQNAKILLNIIFVDIVFCYYLINIIDSDDVTIIFCVIKNIVEKSNVLILCATYLHFLKICFDFFQKKIERSFKINIKTNIHFVRQFFDSKKKYNQFKILINVSIVTIYTQ